MHSRRHIQHEVAKDISSDGKIGVVKAIDEQTLLYEVALQEIFTVESDQIFSPI